MLVERHTAGQEHGQPDGAFRVGNDERKRERKRVHATRRLRLRGQAGNVHCSRPVLAHIRRWDGGQRDPSVDIRPAQAHAERAQHLHT